MYGLIASATFGLIPLFSIPAHENGVGLDSLLFYRFSLASVLVNQQHFQVNVTDADNKLHTYYQGVSGVTIDLVGGSNASVDAKTTVTPTLKVSGIENLTSASKVQVLYIPKMYANGSITDSYSDVYGTWDITDAIKVTIVD